MPHIVIVGQFPPPVTGLTYITQEISKLIAQNHPTTIIDLSPHQRRDGLAFHFRRLNLTIQGIIPLFRYAINDTSHILYVAGESRLGLLYNIILCFIAKKLKYKIYFHHHNFNYIDTFSKPMEILLSAIGSDATHIFLCQKMADLFSIRYGKTVKYEILSNSAFIEIPALPDIPKHSDILKIGLLSNLNNDKGLKIFLNLVRQAKKENLNIKGILAGPTESKDDRTNIEIALKELGDKLEYRGAIYGTQKVDFFRDIDVFVFPTTYSNEAQPTVIFEAMAFGIPTLSYDRGCILSQVEKQGAAQEQQKDFIPFAMNWLMEQLANPTGLLGHKLDARKLFLADREKALHNMQKIFSKL